MATRFRNLAQTAPALGGHDYGLRIADFQRSAVGTGKDSPAEVLEKLHRTLLDFDKALEVAVNKYREAEESAASPIDTRQV